MNIGFWNVRGGLHEPRKQREVTSFLTKNNINFFGLLETKLNSSNLELFKKNTVKDWGFVDNFSVARNGRILLTWNPARLILNIVSIEAQVIHTKVECQGTGNRFHVATCYGRNQLQERRELWDSLIENCPSDEPLLVCGDFNNVLDFEERKGGRPPIEREVREFADTVAYLNLQDCPSTGCFFTWTNGSIFSRIDRIMHNNAWLESGWAIKCHFHTRGTGFDHSPCSAELFNPTKRFRCDFKYCNYWNDDPMFRQELDNSWRRDFGNIEG